MVSSNDYIFVPDTGELYNNGPDSFNGPRAEHIDAPRRPALSIINSETQWDYYRNNFIDITPVGNAVARRSLTDAEHEYSVN